MLQQYLFIISWLLHPNIIRIVYDILMIDDDEDKEKEKKSKKIKLGN